MTEPLPPLNAIALSPNNQHIVVGGRSVFKIISFQSNGETKEIMNFRTGKQNMNYSVLDVEWHPTDKELICTAPTNGAVCLWNCETKRKKLTHVLREHTRTVNKVSWHCEGHTFFTGSQDTTIKMWDIRDLDQSMATLVDKKNDGEVRFVECHHSNPDQIVAALDNGVVQVWDIKYFVKPLVSINNAHQGVILAARWHPEAGELIATGGRDGQIKIWDISTASTQPLAVINTPVGVGNLLWRPRTSQILSVGINSNFDLNLWTLSSPGVPLATIEKHTDVCKGICFIGNNVVVSCGMDGHVFQSDLMTDSTFPHKKLRMTTLAWNVNGDIAATAEKTKRKNVQFGTQSGTSPNKFGGRSTSFYAQRAHAELSTPQISVKSLQDLPNVMIALGQIKKNAPRMLNIINPRQHSCGENYDSQDIIYFAEHYKFQGDTTENLCRHNANVAKELNYPKIASIWEILGIISAQWAATVKTDVHATEEDDFLKKKGANSSTNLFSQSSSSFDQSRKTIPQFSDGLATPVKQNPSATNKQDFDIYDSHNKNSNSSNNVNMNSTTQTNFASKMELESNRMQQQQSGYDDFLDDDISTIIPLYGSTADLSKASQTDLKPKSEIALNQNQNLQQPTSLNPYSTPILFSWKDDSIILDALNYQVEHGDVQTPVFVYLIFYDSLKDIIDENQALLWFHYYIELLRKLRMFVSSAHIIKYCPLDRIRERSTNMTKQILTCANCNKVLFNQAWFCAKCSKLVLCSICHKPMKGTIAWCQGCGHGGHLEHMKDWFTHNSKCPTGCSHICQYKQIFISNDTDQKQTQAPVLIKPSIIELSSQKLAPFPSTLLTSPLSATTSIVNPYISNNIINSKNSSKSNPGSLVSSSQSSSSLLTSSLLSTISSSSISSKNSSLSPSLLSSPTSPTTLSVNTTPLQSPREPLPHHHLNSTLLSSFISSTRLTSQS